MTTPSQLFPLVVLLAAAGGSPHALLAQDRVAELDSVLTLLHEREMFSGVVLISENGQVAFGRSYGPAPDGKQVTRHNPLPIASITKTFTAAGVMMLEAEGRLSYDDPITGIHTARSVAAHRRPLPLGPPGSVGQGVAALGDVGVGRRLALVSAEGDQRNRSDFLQRPLGVSASLNHAARHTRCDLSIAKTTRARRLAVATRAFFQPSRVLIRR